MYSVYTGHCRFSPVSRIVKVIILRCMRWAGRVVRMGEMRNAYKILVGNLKGRDHSDDPDVGGRIILEWISVTYGGKLWLNTSCSE